MTGPFVAAAFYFVVTVHPGGEALSLTGPWTRDGCIQIARAVPGAQCKTFEVRMPRQ